MLFLFMVIFIIVLIFFIKLFFSALSPPTKTEEYSVDKDNKNFDQIYDKIEAEIRQEILEKLEEERQKQIMLNEEQIMLNRYYIHLNNGEKYFIFKKEYIRLIQESKKGSKFFIFKYPDSNGYDREVTIFFRNISCITRHMIR